MPKVYRAGVVGCGRIGSEFDVDPKRRSVSTHAGAYSAIARIELVTLCDSDAGKLAMCGRRWNVSSTYTDVEQMLRAEDLDILSICTWNDTHLDIASKAVSHGIKAIFCEKPIADTLENGHRMVRLCDEAGVLLQIDHQRRFCPFHNRLRDLLKDGTLGEPKQAAFYYTNGIANTGSHMFDLMGFFLDDVDWVWGFRSATRTLNEGDPNIDGMIRFTNGTVCSIHSLDVKDYLVFELDLLCSRGRMRIRDSGFGLDLFEVGKSRHFSGYKELVRAARPFRTDMPRDNMVNGVKHLLKCLDDGTRSISGGTEGLKALEVICAFHESARSGKKVNIPLESSDVVIRSR